MNSHDCLIAIVGLSLLLNVLMIFFYARMKKVVGTMASSLQLLGEFQELSKNCAKLNDEFEKVAMIRISELEDKIRKLNDINMVSEARMVQMDEIQKNLETMLPKLQSGIRSAAASPAAPQPAGDPDLITRLRLNMKPDLTNLEGRMTQRIREEISRAYDDLMKKIEDARITAEPVPRPVETAFIKPPDAPAAKESPKYIMPQENLEPLMNGPYAEICRLACEQGLDAAQISEITKKDQRTINFILNLLGRKQAAQ